MQVVCDRSCCDGRLYHRRHIQSRTDQATVLECGWRGERIRLGKVPLPTRPSTRSAGQSTSKPPSMTPAKQMEETYPDLSNLKRELERVQWEKNKANLDRDSAKLDRNQVNLERDQAIIESDQARRDLDMLKAEYLQEQRARENAANCEQLKSELEKIQRRQRELDRQKEKGTRSELLSAQRRSHVWRWMRLPGQRDDST